MMGLRLHKTLTNTSIMASAYNIGQWVDRSKRMVSSLIKQQEDKRCDQFDDFRKIFLSKLYYPLTGLMQLFLIILSTFW